VLRIRGLIFAGPGFDFSNRLDSDPAQHKLLHNELCLKMACETYDLLTENEFRYTVYVQHFNKFQPLIYTKKVNNTVRTSFLQLSPRGPYPDPQTSYNIDCALGTLCYIRACSI
jgi:hypothetical protein